MNEQEKNILSVDNTSNTVENNSNNNGITLYQRRKSFELLTPNMQKNILKEDEKMAYYINEYIKKEYKSYQQLADMVCKNIDKLVTDKYNIRLRSDMAKNYGYIYISDFTKDGIALAIKSVDGNKNKIEYVYISKNGIIQDIDGLKEKKLLHISEFSEYKAYIVVNNSLENECFYIAYDNNTKSLIRISPSYSTANLFSDGIALVSKKITNNEGVVFKKQIFINHKFAQVSPKKDVKYKQLQSFSEGYGAVQLLNNKWKFINKKMELVGDEFDEIKLFNGGIAAIKDNNKWYLIDENFNRINKEGYNDVKYGKYPGIYAYQLDNEKWVLFNLNTQQQILNEEFDDVGTFCIDGIAWVKKNGKFYYIDTEGKKLFNQDYDIAFDFKDGVAKVKKDGKYFYINLDGEVVF